MNSLSNNPAISTTTSLNFANDSHVINNPNLPHGFVHRGVHHPDINAAISQFGLGFGHDLSEMHTQGTSYLNHFPNIDHFHYYPDLYQFRVRRFIRNGTNGLHREPPPLPLVFIIIPL